MAYSDYRLFYKFLILVILAWSAISLTFIRQALAEPVDFNLPAQSLSQSLKDYGRITGATISSSSQLVSGKNAPAINGRMEPETALNQLLKGSGLRSIRGADGIIIEQSPNAQNIQLDTVNVRAQRYHEIGPMPGLALTKEQIPGNVQSITAEEIKESHSLSIADLMNSKMQSVTVNDYQGNPFQMDLQYRGFTASPQLGTPQGLSVFFDGIRVNEPFGDVVNWDLIPMNALAGLDVFPGSNPIFGLGTLGGAVAMRTKDGFNYPGVEAEVLAGSFGRKQLQVSGGINNANTDEEGSWDAGNFALFGAGSFFLEDGWRDNSPSRVNQVFGKASYRGEKLDLNLNTLLVKTDLVGNGLIPSEMYRQDREGVFTSPDTTENTLVQFQVSGNYWVTDNFSVTAQAYRRDSRRNSLGADVYTEHQEGIYRRALNLGEEYTCLFNSTNDHGYSLPDYYVVDLPDPNNFFSSLFMQTYIFSGGDAQAALASVGATLNPVLHDTPQGAAYVTYAESMFNTWKNPQQALNYQAQGNYVPTELDQGPPINGPGSESAWYAGVYNGMIPNNVVFNGLLNPFSAMTGNYYYTDDGVKHLVLFEAPTNLANCTATQATDWSNDGGPLSVEDPNTGVYLTVDGASSLGGQQPGVVAGTPTGVLTNTDIDQLTEGASVQLNWNYPKHKFMVGVSIDAPSATYRSGQRLGLMDAQRNVFLAPDQIRDQYAAADLEIRNNDFEGDQLTKSIYFSETWSPVETLHITGAARYNDTHGKNKVASRTWGARVFDLARYEALPDYFDLCVDGDCPTAGYQTPDLSRIVNKPETEKFSYYSLNPSLGVSWQANPALNIYGNWGQGTRVPSVIELGCAFDNTPIEVGGTNGATMPKSLYENRACSLPTTLSGDPYLPQIKAQTLDFGLRGRWGDKFEWNLGVYQTDLQDDLYLVSFPGNRSFFDTVGDTRRRGLEAGISGEMGKFGFRLNYALTDATFQETFMLAADHNSSSVENFYGNFNFGRLIEVNPGDRMPGVPLHNLNATLSYEVTPKWQIGLTAVAHSMSYVRGNENNEHRENVTIYDSIHIPGTPAGFQQIPRRKTKNPGTVPGYVVFNLQTSYQLAPEWTLGLQVNNIFDREYFSAGRLGRNPFSPSVYGAIGPGGYNHNSSDWLSTNFLAPGAPRAAWISLSYEFDPRK